jgi:hypothetical protein
MATSRQFLVGAVVAAAAIIAAPAAPAAQASAQSSRKMLADPGASAMSGAALNPAVIEDAQRFMTDGRFKDARRVYRTIIAEKRAAGEYAVDALRGLANAEFALNDNRATAFALDELADAAGQFGDPETRIHALFDAAVLYQGLKYHDRVASHIGDIRALLKSPAIAEATRADIADRIPKR